MSSGPSNFGRIAWTFAWEGVGRSYARSGAQRPFSFRFSAFSQIRPISQYNVRRHCSGGLLLLGLDTSAPTSQTIVSSCNAVAEGAVPRGNTTAGPISRLARQAWARNVHTTSSSAGRIQRRLKSTQSGEEENTHSAHQKLSQSQPGPQNKDPKDSQKKPGEGHDSLTDSVSKYLHLPHLPKMPPRPTKEELLAAATGFWQRLKVRFKWFSIRSTRPFNADEWGAFLSWILFGHFVWILVGTTTFVSLLILMVNTVFAQGKSDHT